MANVSAQLVGKRFGRLVAERQEGRYHWCRCDCGSEPRKYRTDHLKGGNTQSCGCLRVEAGRTTGLANAGSRKAQEAA